MALGDVFAQYLERRSTGSESYKPSRTLILASWASLASAPFWVWFYRFLNRRFPGRTITWVAMSAALSPAWNGAFFSYSTAATHVVDEGFLNTLSGDGLAHLGTKVRSKLETQLFPTVQRSLALWIPFNFVNFRYVHLDYRTLTGSTVALAWNVFLSMQAASEKSTSHAVEPPQRIV